MDCRASLAIRNGCSSRRPAAEPACQWIRPQRQSVEMPYRAQWGDRGGVKLDIGIARRQPHWDQIVHAADAHAAFDDVRRQAEVALPIGRQCNRGEVPARRLTTEIEPVRIAAEMCGIPVYPGDGAADLIGEHHETATDILHPG